MKVRKNGIYQYNPCMWDILDPKTPLQGGESVRVIHPWGCPKPNTMNHAHIESLDGKFLGLVHCNSLHSPQHE